MKAEIKIEIPETYLSKTEMGWNLIKNGLPLCAETSKEKARQAALHFKLKLPSVFWDGINGKFEEETQISCSQCGQGFGFGETGFSHCVDHKL